MTASDQYREFAAQCFNFAAEAKTEERRKILEEMARTWKVLAEDAEERDGLR